MTGMWACPACGRSFANRNQVHTCAALGDLDRHFAGTDPLIRATFGAVLAAVARLRRRGQADGGWSAQRLRADSSSHTPPPKPCP